MPTIHRLPNLVVDKIAAGEVVENPASALKEIVENALDAEATQVTVAIRKGGMTSIQVVDNGKGIAAEDLELAFERHATSKISQFEDLAQVRTMGFRGEALASIGSVAHVTLASQSRDAKTGASITVKGGEKAFSDAMVSQPGTTITVEHLFFNTPVRRRFLKSVAAETRRCTQVIFTYCLAYPEIGFHYSVDGVKKYQFPPGQSMRDRARELLGRELEESLVPLALEKDVVIEGGAPIKLAVRGFVGKPNVARANRQQQYLFINKRPVTDFLLSHRIKEAFGTLLERTLHPAYFLVAELPTEYVDVNVHPRKSEVRFPQTFPFYNLAAEAVRRTLQEHDLTTTAPGYGQATSGGAFGGSSISRESAGFPSGDTERPQYPQGFGAPQTGGSARGHTQDNWGSSSLAAEGGWNTFNPNQPFATRGGFRQEDVFSFGEQAELIPSAAMTPGQRALPQVLSQILSTYILARDEEGILLIDQHAAQERLLYEHFLQATTAKTLPEVQELLIPETFSLTEIDKAVLSEREDFFSSLGIGLEVFGEGEGMVRFVPTFWVGHALIPAIRAMLDQLAAEKDSVLPPAVQDRIITKACKASIKAHERLDHESMERLVADLYACEQPYTCPHGRPTLVRLDQGSLEKLFHRR